MVEEGEYREKALTVLEHASSVARDLGVATGKANFEPKLALEIVGVFHSLSSTCHFISPMFAVAKVLLEKYQVPLRTHFAIDDVPVVVCETTALSLPLTRRQVMKALEEDIEAFQGVMQQRLAIVARVFKVQHDKVGTKMTAPTCMDALLLILEAARDAVLVRFMQLVLCPARELRHCGAVCVLLSQFIFLVCVHVCAVPLGALAHPEVCSLLRRQG